MLINVLFLIKGDGWEHGCRGYSSGHASNCRENDLFWIKDCRSRGTRFNVIQRKDKRGRDIGYQLKLDGRNLCIERINVHLVAKRCDSDERDQLWTGWHDMDKFELRPAKMKNWSEREAICVSQLHHPKDEELIGMHNCRLNRIYETLYWEEYGWN